MLRSGTDFYRSNRGFNVDFGWVGGFFDPFTNGVFTNGGFSNEDFFVNESNTDFLLTSVTNPLAKLGLTVNLGGNLRARSLSQSWIGTDALVAPGVYNVANAATQYTPYQYNENRKINSLYGSTQFAYNDVFFVDVTGRNDWSSTLPKGNNSFFYPSVSSSLVFTDLLPGGHLGGALTYGKLRGAWTRVGNDADPYLTVQTFSTFSPFGSAPRFSVKDVVANKDLKPEQTDAWEVGTELSFFNGRAGLDATYYQKTTTNQILNIDVSRATGFSNAAINAGQLSNKGVELQLVARVAAGLFNDHCRVISTSAGTSAGGRRGRCRWRPSAPHPPRRPPDRRRARAGRQRAAPAPRCRRSLRAGRAPRRRCR